MKHKDFFKCFVLTSNTDVPGNMLSVMAENPAVWTDTD